MDALAPYRETVKRQKARLVSLLCQAEPDANWLRQPAMLRRTIQLMENDLEKNPSTVLGYNTRTSTEPGQVADAIAWMTAKAAQAEREFFPTGPELKRILSKVEEYGRYLSDFRRKLDGPINWFTDPKNGIKYVTEPNENVREALKPIFEVVTSWVAIHKTDPDFLKISVAEGILQALEPRQDLLVKLRLAHVRGRDVYQVEVEVERQSSSK
jgi:hypothetical protein